MYVCMYVCMRGVKKLIMEWVVTYGKQGNNNQAVPNNSPTICHTVTLLYMSIILILILYSMLILILISIKLLHFLSKIFPMLVLLNILLINISLWQLN